MKYAITKSTKSLLVTLDTESGKYAARVTTFNDPNVILGNNDICLLENGRPLIYLKPHEIGLIDGVAATNLGDAVAKINVLIDSITAGAGLKFKGSVVPTDVPTGTEDALWVATQAGTYTNFGNFTLPANSRAEISRVSGAFTRSITAFVIPAATNKTAPFIDGSWPVDSQVNFIGKDWYNIVATIAGEIPGASSKWVDRLPALANIENSINIFDKSAVTPSGYYDSISLAWVSAATLSESEFISVKQGDVINFKLTNTSSRHIVYKNTSGVIFTGVYVAPISGVITRTIGADITAVAIQLYNSELSTVMITKNQSLPTEYVSFFKNRLPITYELNGASILDKSIPKAKTNFKTIEDVAVFTNENANIFNKKTAILGGYYFDGVWTADVNIDTIQITGFKVGDVLRIKHTRSITSVKHFSYLDINNTVIISGTQIPTNGVNQFTPSTSNIVKLCVQISHSDLDFVMATINADVPTVYIPFGGNVALNENMIYSINKLNEKPAEESYLSGRLLLWEENFEGNTLDENSWNKLVRKSVPTGIEALTNRSKNVRLENGKLIIQAIKEKFNGKSWTSAMINTIGKRNFLYGRIEARMKLPANSGTWPAFWTLGSTFNLITNEEMTTTQNGGNPYCGEIDIMEAYGTNKTESRMHTPTALEGGIVSSPIVYSPFVKSYEYNVYGKEWTSEKVDFLVNGLVTGTYNVNEATVNGRNPYREPHYLILNLAMQTETASTLPINTMEVDWVRVYAPTDVVSYVLPTSISVYKRNVTFGTGNTFFQSLPLIDTEITSLNLTIGERVLLVSTVLPANSAEKTISWKSDNEKIATCNSGVVVGVTAGTCTVRVMTSNYVVKNLVITVS